MTTPTGLLRWGQAGRYTAWDDRVVISALAGLRTGIIRPASLAPATGLDITVEGGWLAIADCGDGTVAVVASPVASLVGALPGGEVDREDQIVAEITDPETAQWSLSVTAAAHGGIALGAIRVPAGAQSAAEMELIPYEQDFSTGGAIPGPRGPAGPEGPSGEQGEPGPQGTGLTMRPSVPTVADLPATGNQAGDLRVVEATGDAWVWEPDATPAQWLNVGPIRGPAGPAGPPGAQGGAGPPGGAGPQGADGPQGDTGPRGEGVPSYPADMTVASPWGIGANVTAMTQVSRTWPVAAGVITEGSVIRFTAWGAGNNGSSRQALGMRGNVGTAPPAGPGLGRIDMGSIQFAVNTGFAWRFEQELWFTNGGPNAAYNSISKFYATVLSLNVLATMDSAQGTIAAIRTGSGTLDAGVEQRLWLEAQWGANSVTGFLHTFGSLLEVVTQWPQSPRLGGVAERPVFTNPGQPPPPPAPETNYTTTYRPFMTASYHGNGNRRNINGDLFQGAASGLVGTTGNQFGLAMYDYGAMRRDLAGARIQWATVTMRMNHSWWNNGGDLRLGWSNRTDLPASGVWEPVNAGGLGVHNFTRGQTREININSIMNALAGTGFTAIVVGGDGGNGTNLQRYVVFDGGTSTPFIRVNYSK